MDGPRSPLPRKVGAKGQAQLPPELMAQLDITPGQNVWIGLNPDRPGTLILIPDALMDEVFRKGWISAG